MNSVCLIGRLTADPELRKTANGKAVASALIAVDRMKEGADFLPVVAWEKTAEFICKYFHKGKMMGIAGEIRSRSYETREGEKRRAVEVLAQRAYFCGDKEKEDGGDSRYEESFPEEGDLPF